MPFAAPAHEGGDVQRGRDDADAVAHDLRGDQEGIHVRVLLLRTMFGSAQAFWMRAPLLSTYQPVGMVVKRFVAPIPRVTDNDYLAPLAQSEPRATSVLCIRSA